MDGEKLRGTSRSYPQLDQGYGCSDIEELTTLCSLKALGKRPLFTWESSQEPPNSHKHDFYDPQVSPGNPFGCFIVSSKIAHDCKKDRGDFSAHSVYDIFSQVLGKTEYH